MKILIALNLFVWAAAAANVYALTVMDGGLANLFALAFSLAVGAQGTARILTIRLNQRDARAAIRKHLDRLR